MPAMPAASQSERNRKYQKKAGIITKSIKVHKDISEAFKASCAAAGISQNAAIIGFMQDFIEKHPVK